MNTGKELYPKILKVDLEKGSSTVTLSDTKGDEVCRICCKYDGRFSVEVFTSVNQIMTSVEYQTLEALVDDVLASDEYGVLSKDEILAYSKVKNSSRSSTPPYGNTNPSTVV